jgi:hypothetical protein
VHVQQSVVRAWSPQGKCHSVVLAPVVAKLDLFYKHSVLELGLAVHSTVTTSQYAVFGVSTWRYGSAAATAAMHPLAHELE